MRRLALGLLIAAGMAEAAEPGVKTLHAADAGADLTVAKDHAGALLKLARAHIAAVGLDRALKDFVATPWRRRANGLHLWGVTRDGESWFDAGHPELVGLNTIDMTDLAGNNWVRLGVASATGEGAAFFLLTFPHPETHRAARGWHTCFMLDDDHRLLCAGASEDLG
jgi:hypothetical protein